MSELADRTCKAGAVALDADAAAGLFQELDGWEILEATRLRKDYAFEDFAGALAFVVRVGEVAEAEWHHPDLTLGWGRVSVELTTHDRGGLTENDFVLAAKCDRAL